MDYKKEFIKFMAECGVLTFGSFTLKSGRQAPYFINTGNYRTGGHIARLGEFYAQCIIDYNISFDTLFGPAYKGIPLAVACAASLWRNFGKDAGYCFDRKEAKDHGEGGIIVGKQLEDGERVLIIEDVITAGTAIRQVVPILKGAADVELAGVVISVDRMERGRENISAVEEVKRDFGIDVYPIVTVSDIIEALRAGEIDGAEYLGMMLEYRNNYGI